MPRFLTEEQCRQTLESVTDRSYGYLSRLAAELHINRKTLAYRLSVAEDRKDGFVIPPRFNHAAYMRQWRARRKKMAKIAEMQHG